MRGYAIIRPLVKLWYIMTLAEGGVFPRPRDEARVQTGDASADRVLLFGNGPCHGWGVSTHELSLVGQLGSALRARTGRPADIDYVGEEAMNAASAMAWLGATDLSAYDAVIVVMGMNDAVRLTPEPLWEETVGALLDRLTSETPEYATILVAGIQPVRSIPVYDNPFGRIAQWHANHLNAITRRLVDARPRAAYFALGVPTPNPDRPLGSRDAYREWAEMLTDEVAPELDAAADGARSRRPDPDRPVRGRAFTWQGSARTIEAARSDGTPELQRIAAVAKSTFGVDIAVTSILEGDRLWYANPAGLPSSIPRELAYCNVASKGGAPMVVPDSRKDDRFRSNPLIDLGHLVFYAGVPLVSRAGSPIGTFCIMNSTPKKAASISLPALESLAGEAQAELWRIEAEAAG
ncbi:GAF domain-containing protein [Marisediminicola senii]|uniref:GAF domain-containing protein n=1 Tax=Marisediminicola senii TaxID=2711233 RepID=UPI0013EAEAAA|nr:GAF domain-containing protein [Marisediminicola senii]